MQVFSEKLEGIWEEAVNGGPYDREGGQAEIFLSWERCRGKIDPYSLPPYPVLKSEELQALTERHEEFITLGSSVLESLQESQGELPLVVGLAEPNGCILKVIGDPHFMEEMAKLHFIVGANWAEKNMGTNALGSCLALGKPLQVYGAEHWRRPLHSLSCSAAPIHDPDSGQMIGALTLLSPDRQNDRLLFAGLVSTIVGAIEAKIETRRHLKRFEQSQKYGDLIVDAFSDGLIILDDSGVITHINQKAREFLKAFAPGVGEKFHQFLTRHFGQVEKNYPGLLAVLEGKEDADEKLMILPGENGSAHYQINSRRFAKTEGRIGQTIAIRQIAVPPPPDKNLPRSAARYSFSDLIGKSPLFLENIEVGMRAAGTSANVLITGESGTGKELFAQAIHNHSSRARAPFVAINCAAIPRDLLASELFGYMEGAFTGARKGGNPGKFELADHGTIFLDEIGDMPLDMQVSLLRVIEEKRVMRLGAREAIPADARIIAATNKNLYQDVALGRFRADLYYRLNVISIELPALRERREDIPLLVAHLARKIAGAMGRKIPQIDPEFMEMCQQYSWPGNIRELMNLIEKVLSFTNKPVLSLQDLPSSYCSRYLETFVPAVPAEGEKNPLKEASLNVEKKVIKAALSRNRGNKSLAAKELGIARSSLYRKMGEIGVVWGI